MTDSPETPRPYSRRSALALAGGALVASQQSAHAQTAPARPAPARAAQPSVLDRSQWRLTFADEFDTLSYDKEATLPLNGKWQTWLNNGGRDNFYARHLHRLQEQQYYVDRYILDKLCSDIPRYERYDPFSLVDSPEGKALRITARLMDPAMARAMRNRLGMAQGRDRAHSSNPWASGCLTTYEGFRQRYGLFEARVKLPATPGAWPAFWMLVSDRGYSVWPPEINIFDNYPQNGARNRWLIGGKATRNIGFGPRDGGQDGVVRPYRIADNWRTISLEWTPEFLIYYSEGVEMFRHPTPRQINENMFIIMNLAIVAPTNTWAEHVPAGTSNIAMDIEWVRVWARP